MPARPRPTTVGSGFARGHMVPVRDLAWLDASIAATFLLSNAVSQNRRVNPGRWRRPEDAVRLIAARSVAVYVFTGPLFESPEIRFISRGRAAVPSVPNEEGPPLKRTIGSRFSVDEGESRAGLDFFSAWQDSEERRLESTPERFRSRARSSRPGPIGQD